MLFCWAAVAPVPVLCDKITSAAATAHAGCYVSKKTSLLLDAKACCCTGKVQSGWAPYVQLLEPQALLNFQRLLATAWQSSRGCNYSCLLHAEYMLCLLCSLLHPAPTI